MISLSTNVTSLMVSSNLKSNTSSLNSSLKRLSTGFKINNSQDNAANFSIATTMTTQLAAYKTAQDNVSFGLDLASTASSILAEMQSKTERLTALSTQARNGTYGAASLQAMNQEASSIVSELLRIYNTAEYNNIQLFNKDEIIIPDGKPKAGESGFIDETDIPQEFSAGASGFIDESFTKIDTNNMTTLTEAIAEGKTIKGGTWAISSVKDLLNLADITNQTTNYTTGTTFVLAKDIDLSGVQNWIPIGNYSKTEPYNFCGTFNGNGHVISNINVDSTIAENVGLFGRIQGATIENLGLENVNVQGVANVGALVGYGKTFTINNCFTTGYVSGTSLIGGLVGRVSSSVSATNCYATCEVSGNNYIGGLMGNGTGSVTNCFATGKVSGNNYIGGLVGNYFGSITNCYMAGNVDGNGYVGGLVGQTSSSSSITNCFTTGNVTGTGDWTGGLIGENRGTVSNTYATGNVIGGNYNCGGLIGRCTGTLSNSYATGNVTATGTHTGGLIGIATNSCTITNSFATGNVNGNKYAGGLIGTVECLTGYSTDITNCYSTGTVTGAEGVGEFIGRIYNTTDQVSFGNINITDCAAINKAENFIGGTYNGAVIYHYDKLDEWLNQIKLIKPLDISTHIQAGIYNDKNSEIQFNTNFKFDFSSLAGGIEKEETLNAIMEFTNELNAKQTELGAVQNRLFSALDQVSVNIETLTSARSTKLDADISKESSKLIRNQILQQASATLLSTANQQPTIALTLLQGIY